MLINIFNWVSQFTQVCEYICFWLGSDIWGCDIKSNHRNKIYGNCSWLYATVTVKQVSAGRRPRAAQIFKDIEMCWQTPGAHKESLRFSVRVTRSVSPLAAAWRIPLTIKGNLVSWAGSQGVLWGACATSPGGHPSRASCVSTEMLASCSVFKAEAFLSWEHLPQRRGRGKKPWIFHVNSSDTVNLLFQEIPFPDLTQHFHSPTSFTKIYISLLFFSHANHVHYRFDYIVMK